MVQWSSTSWKDTPGHSPGPSGMAHFCVENCPCTYPDPVGPNLKVDGAELVTCDLMIVAKGDWAAALGSVAQSKEQEKTIAEQSEAIVLLSGQVNSLKDQYEAAQAKWGLMVAEAEKRAEAAEAELQNVVSIMHSHFDEARGGWSCVEPMQSLLESYASMKEEHDELMDRVDDLQRKGQGLG